MRRTTIWLDEDLYQLIKRMSEKEFSTMSDLIRTTLRENLDAPKREKVTIPDGSDKEVLKVTKEVMPLVEKAIELKKEKGGSFNPVPKTFSARKGK